MKIGEFIQLKDKVDILEKRLNEHKGILIRIQQELKQDFNCNTIEQAHELLVRLNKDLKAIEDKFEKEFGKFGEEYKHVFDSVSY